MSEAIVLDLSLEEINARLAEAADEMRARWDELEAAAQTDQISDWVAGEINSLRGLTDARRAHIARIEKVGSVYELAERLGWNEAETAHALDSLQACMEGYGEECVVVTHSGREIRSAAYPAPCDYIRITQHGFELAYWSSEEWKEAPEEVIGAVMGSLHHNYDAPESVDLTSTIDTQRHRGRQEGLL